MNHAASKPSQTPEKGEEQEERERERERDKERKKERKDKVNVVRLCIHNSTPHNQLSSPAVRRQRPSGQKSD